MNRRPATPLDELRDDLGGLLDELRDPRRAGRLLGGALLLGVVIFTIFFLAWLI